MSLTCTLKDNDFLENITTGFTQVHKGMIFRLMRNWLLCTKF